MTSALRGEPSKADIVNNLRKGRLREFAERGVKQSQNFADVIYGNPQERKTERERRAITEESTVGQGF